MEYITIKKKLKTGVSKSEESLQVYEDWKYQVKSKNQNNPVYLGILVTFQVH